MNRLVMVCMAAVFGLGIVFSAPGTVAAATEPPAAPEAHPADTWNDDGHQANDVSAVPLTEKQKKRLAKLHERLFKDHKALIELYAEYGLITEEQKARKLEWLKKHHEQIKANDYRPFSGKKKHPHHAESHHPEFRSTEPNPPSEQDM